MNINMTFIQVEFEPGVSAEVGLQFNTEKKEYLLNLNVKAHKPTYIVYMEEHLSDLRKLLGHRVRILKY